MRCRDQRRTETHRLLALTSEHEICRNFKACVHAQTGNQVEFTDCIGQWVFFEVHFFPVSKYASLFPFCLLVPLLPPSFLCRGLQSASTVLHGPSSPRDSWLIVGVINQSLRWVGNSPARRGTRTLDAAHQTGLGSLSLCAAVSYTVPFLYTVSVWD